MMRYARKSEYTFYVIIKADYLNSRYQKPRSKDHNFVVSSTSFSKNINYYRSEYKIQESSMILAK